MNQDLIEQRTRRISWAEELTVRIALLELHNDALDGQRAEIGWDGSLPLWDRARKAAFEDLDKYDIDKGGFAALDRRAPRWGSGVLHFGLTLMGDLLCVGLASFLSGAPANSMT